MSEYTSTREGLQRSIELSLTGSPADTKSYAEATVAPGFYQIANGEKRDYAAYIKHIEQQRAVTTEWKPVVHEFLRDGDQLAARLTGTLKISGAPVEFETFLFGKVGADGRVTSLIERSVGCPVAAK